MSRDNTLRLVAWNIRAGGGRRGEHIARQIARWAPDAVVLSEFRATPPSLLLAQALASHGLVHQLTTADARVPGRNALLVAARWPLRRIRLGAAPRARLPSTPRRSATSRSRAPTWC